MSRKFEAKPLIFGIQGTILTKQESDFFKNNPVLGFILFTRNIESAAQLKALTSSLKELYPHREVPILIDQEGGRVARIKPPIAEKLYETAEHFSKLYDQSQEEGLEATKNNYADIMRELKSFSIDSPCTPVADLRIPGAHDVIGDRSFGREVEKVAALCNAAIEGTVQEGGIPIIKHMPGHGRAMSDSHLELPRVTTSLDELNQTDFQVFRTLSANPYVKWAMTAHIVFDCIDPEKPITCSTKGINFIREDIGFEGIVLTDAIEMLALHGEVGTKYGAIKSVLSDIDNEKPIREDSLTILKGYSIVDDGFAGKTKREQLVDISSKKEQIDLDFTKSLVKVSTAALKSGCNIVLHCTGEFEQMKAIAESIQILNIFEL